ncbi:MAG: hypothetical protein JSS81_25290 [Acidobacteria bacterium]|nr:hypothetical protein [Acidobacteriota bacterium]
MFTLFFARTGRFIKTCGVALFILILLFAELRAERLPVRVYTTVNGLGSSAVNDILYDSRGFMWFGTRSGLSRFDGFRFNNYKFGGEPAADSIFRIIERRNGDYLVIKQSHGVYRFNAATTVSDSGADEMASLNAEKIFETPTGRFYDDLDNILWVLDTGNLVRFSETDGRLAAEPPLSIALPGEPNLYIFRYLEDSARTFWLSTNRGLVRIDKTGRVLALYTTPPPTAMQTYLTSLFADRKNRIWVVSPDGLFVLKPDPVDSSIPYKTRPLTENIRGRLPENAGEVVKYTAADGFRGQEIPAFHESADGRIWLASELGLLLFDGTNFRLFNTENGLGENLTDITEDSEGNLWVSSLSGVYKIVTDGLTTYTRADGLGRTDIAAIYQNRAGELFTAEGDWFVSRFDGQRFDSAQPALGPDRGLPLWTSNVSFLDSKGAWWFLTEKKLFRFDDVRQIADLARKKPSMVVESGPDFNNGAFYRLFEDSHENIWTSMRSANFEKFGLDLWRREENRFYAFGEKENFPPRHSPSAFCEDRQGNLWIGFYHGGLVVYRHGKFHYFGPEDGVPDGFITALFLDRYGRIWVATSDSGVHVIEDPEAEKPIFKKIEGISSNNVRAIADDHFGRLYFGTVRGLDRLSPDSNRVFHLSTIDGLADDFVTVAFRDQSGAMWFGTKNGLSRLIPKPEQPAQPPPILIAGLRIAGDKQPVSELGAAELGRLDLKNTQNNLQIDFFSVGFTAPERIRYQFRLDGADQDWSQPTAERTVNYSNLAAGEYRFQVRAVNSQGLASTNPATVVFRIAPPIWKTWWFSALAVLLTVGAIYFLLNQRFKRFLELEKVRTRIATDLHDDIGASLSRISMLSEIVKHQNGVANPESAKRLTQIATEARGLVDSMSDIVWAINPRRDSIESVVDRLCSFAADTLGTKNVHWTVETPPELKNLKLTAEEKRNLYLIFKEAVNNAARHSGCGKASLKIRLERGQLVAEIFDDGKGFAPAENGGENTRGGRGLENMRTRAAEIGGALEFESKEGAGTKIILTLPFGGYSLPGWLSRRKK